MEKEDQACDIQAKLEAWRRKSGRPAKPDKPWVPRFKKLPAKADSKNAMEVVNQSRVLQPQNSQSLKKDANPSLNVKSKVDSNLSSFRREQLQDWKLKRKQLEAELKENKDKEKRWTISGRRESIMPLNNLTRLPLVTTGFADRSFVKPKSNLANLSLCVPPKNKSVESNLTIKKDGPIAKENMPKTQIPGKDMQGKVFNTALKNPNLPKPEAPSKGAPVKVSNAAFKNPKLPATQIERREAPAKFVNNNLKKPILPKSQAVKIEAPVKVAISSLKNVNLPKTTQVVSKEAQAKVTASNPTRPRVSISSLHRKPAWKSGSKTVTKSVISDKQPVTLENKTSSTSNLDTSISQAERKPWNSGTNVNRSFSVDTTPGISANTSILPGGILKKSKGLLAKSPKVKRNVNFAISPRSPENAPLNERLVSWLLDNNQSPCEYRHLQCFGAAVENENLQPPIRSFDSLTIEENSNVNETKSVSEFETATIHSFDSSGTFVVDNVGDPNVNAAKRVEKVMNELHALLLKSYPIAEASRWLDLIYEKVPEVSRMADYWLCRARIAMSYGAGVEDVLELVEQGIKNGAQPSKKLEDYKKKKTRPSTPRPKKDEGKENIFDSTVVKFKVGEMEPGSKREVKREDTPMRLTPVRRSHRISNSVNSEFASIDEIPLDLKSRLVLTPNRFLDVDLEASNIDENVY